MKMKPILFGALCAILTGCGTTTPLAKLGNTNDKLNNAQDDRLAQVAAPVAAAADVLQKAPPSAPVQAASAELVVAQAGLPIPSALALQAAKDRVADDLAGKHAEADKARQAAKADLGKTIIAVNSLKQQQHDQIVAAQAAEAAMFKHMAAVSALNLSMRLWIASALIITAAAGFSVPRLYLLGGIGMVIGSLPWIAVTLMGNPHYDLISYAVLAVFAAIVAYAAWHGVENGNSARAGAALKKVKSSLANVFGGSVGSVTGWIIAQAKAAWKWAHDFVVHLEQVIAHLFTKPTPPSTPPKA